MKRTIAKGLFLAFLVAMPGQMAAFGGADHANGKTSSIGFCASAWHACCNVAAKVEKVARNHPFFSFAVAASAAVALGLTLSFAHRDETISAQKSATFEALVAVCRKKFKDDAKLGSFGLRPIGGSVWGKGWFLTGVACRDGIDRHSVVVSASDETCNEYKKVTIDDRAEVVS